ncbi:MAG: TolC family protein [Clostridiales bacterium]|nr:TolC family protein [Clostridiales bacterium]
MLKKITSIVLIFLLISLPLMAKASSFNELQVEYLSNSEQLQSLKEQLNDQIDNYVDDYYRYVKMSSRSNLSYNLAYLMINKITGKLNVDWNIERTKEQLLTTTSSLEITFRNLYFSLYSFHKNVNSMQDKYDKQVVAYANSQLLFSQGYINQSSLRVARYTLETAKVSLNSSKRNYENALFSFNIAMKQSINFSDYSWDIEETLLPVLKLSEYLDSFITYSKVIIEYDRQLYKDEIKVDYLDGYNVNVTTNSGSIDYKQTMITMELNQLYKETFITSQSKEIRQLFFNLSQEHDTINNYKTKINIYYQEMLDNKAFAEKGYIDQEEYQEYVECYEASLVTYIEKMYTYNTHVLQLENIACTYMKETF